MPKEKRRNDSSAAGKTVRQIPRDRQIALSYAQDRYWLLSLLEPDNPTYNAVRAVRLTGRFDNAAFIEAVRGLAQRHEVLRIFVGVENGKPLLRFADDPDLPVFETCLADTPEKDSAIRSAIDEFRRQSFDLSKYPLFRVMVAQVAPDDHVAALVVHRIMADEMSLDVLIRDLGLLYSRQTGSKVTLPPLPVQFADFANWQCEQAHGEGFSTLVAYWKERLSGDLPVLELSADYPRPPRTTYNGKTLEFTFSGGHFNALASLCQNEGTAFFSIFLAALSITLRQHTGQEDMILGTKAANRVREGTENMVGLLGTLLPLRMDLSGDPSFREFLKRVSVVVNEARERQELPFERLLEELPPSRDMSRHPLFQVMVEERPSNDSHLRFGGLQSSNFDIGNGSVMFDLDFSFSVAPDGIFGRCNFNTALYSQRTINALVEHVINCLKTVAAHPDSPISSVNILSDAEQHTLIAGRNSDQRPFPDGLAVHHLFEKQAVLTPDQPAVSCAGVTITYSELNRHSNQLARYLRDRGLTDGSRIGICVNRSLDMIIAIMATLKAGCVYVPIDPDYPQDRQSFMIEDADVSVVLTTGGSALQSLPPGTQYIELDKEKNLFSALPDENPDLPFDPQTLLYMIFTSGSTGKPKGSLVFHRGFVNLLSWYIAEFGFDNNSCALVFSSLSFDLTQKNLFAPLISGGHLVLLDTPHYDAERILDLASQYKATIANCTPSAFYGLLGNTSSRSLSRLDSLRFVVLGGEPIYTARMRVWIESPYFHSAIVNSYGPTECTDVVALHFVEDPKNYGAPIPIGMPIPNVQLYILDSRQQLVPDGAPGELCIGGVCVGAGYVKRPELNAEKFVKDPFSKNSGDLIYRTGDRVRYLPDGTIDFLGRIDHQIKLSGYRIELGEILSEIERSPVVKEAYVMSREDDSGIQQLVAYIVLEGAGPDDPVQQIRKSLRATMPEYMIPASFVVLDAMPLTPNGKIDRSKLPAPEKQMRKKIEESIKAGVTAATPLGSARQFLLNRWSDLLHAEYIGIEDRFFELGGTSLKAIQFVGALGQELDIAIPLVSLFQAPTIAEYASYLQGAFPEAFASRFGASASPPQTTEGAHAPQSRFESHDQGCVEIAVIGMSARVPGARNLEEFWQLLRDGVEAVRSLTDEELLRAGVDPETLADPNYVKAASAMDDIEGFDAAFFGLLPREVELMDPQHRALLEGAWSVLEHAGHASQAGNERIGVFAGVARDSYFANNLLSHPNLNRLSGDYSLMIGNEKDFCATRVAYHLNLNGPAITVQTACSSSGVAIHMASQSLLNNDCDIALAGGCRALVPVTGYQYVDGGTLSPDGHVRAFDAKGRGMIRGSGVCFVALKRLDRAKRDGDCIYAVIKSSAVNNDGSNKVGFAAPSVQGQSDVIRQAIQKAMINPETISYVETHGTATSIGDPIEVAALTEAYRSFTDRKAFCAIGSVKTNIGHLDAGSCAAGVIKTILAMRNGQLPPSLNYETPNPQIDFAGSPFFVNSSLRDWSPEDGPRRAGVSSFGLGGTNVHLIIEEFTETPVREGKPVKILPVSAKSSTALDASIKNLSEYLIGHPEANLQDIAYTLQTGRRHFEYRRAVVAGSHEDAVAQMADFSASLTKRSKGGSPSVVFMFPGQGSQHINMGRELYEQEKVYKDTIDRCSELLLTHLGTDLRDILFPAPGREADATALLNQTGLAQPALFTVSYSLAQLLTAWGIAPAAMIGHSIGEYVAACLSGIFSLEDAIRVIATRARLMQSMPAGSMRAVRLPEEQLLPILPPHVALAACNAPSLCVVSGPQDAIDTFDRILEERGLASGVLHTSHAFHSEMMEPIVAPFTEIVAGVDRGNQRIPIVSTLTGSWLKDTEATNAGYWADQLRQPVRFSAALQELLKDRNHIFLECGPSTNLSTSAKAHLTKEESDRVISALPHANEKKSPLNTLSTAVARLWLAGAKIDWEKIHGSSPIKRIGLPHYPFERQRHWIDPLRAKSTSSPASEPEDQLRSAQTSASANLSAALNTSGSSPLSRILQQQLALMNLQIGLLTGAKMPPSAHVTDAMPTPPAAPPAAATEAPVSEAAAAVPAEGEKKTFVGPGLKIVKTQTSGITDRQKRHIDELIKRYNARTKSSKEFAQAHRTHLADPRAASGFKPLLKELVYPIVVNRSLGSRLWDIDGNEYIDMLNGFGSNFFGHRAPFVIEALERQLKTGIEIGPQHPLAGQLAGELSEFLGHDRVAFCNTGSEAVLGAMRIARTITGRDLIAMFTGAYHGIFDEVIVRGTRNQRSVPAAPGIQPGAVANILVLDYATEETLNILKQRAGELAAILVEPVQSRLPELQPKEFLHELRELTKQSGTALIFDEVVTGFRAGPRGAQGHFGIKADLATYGKVLGGGMNIGIIAGDRCFMDALDGGAWQFGDDSVPEVGVTYFAGTFVRHPPALAAAKAVLDHLKAEGPELQLRVNEKTARLVREINEYAERIRVPVKLTHFTSVVRVAFTQDVPLGELLFVHLREKGVHIWDHRPVYMTASHTDEDVSFVIEAFKQSLDEMLKGEILQEI